MSNSVRTFSPDTGMLLLAVRNQHTNNKSTGSSSLLLHTMVLCRNVLLTLMINGMGGLPWRPPNLSEETNALPIPYLYSNFFFSEEANASDTSSSSNESNPVTEIRFVPEDKGTCKY